MNTPCAPCMQSRTALVMGFFGTLYPILICSAGNMLVRTCQNSFRALSAFNLNSLLQQSQMSRTIYLPSLFKEPKKIFQTWQKMVQMKSNLFTGLFVMNIVVAVTVAHLQQKAFYRLNQAQWTMRVPSLINTIFLEHFSFTSLFDSSYTIVIMGHKNTWRVQQGEKKWKYGQNHHSTSSLNSFLLTVRKEGREAKMMNKWEIGETV